MSIEWTRGTSRLRQLAGQWNALSSDPFTGPDWILPWWEAFGEGELLTCLVWRDGQLAAVAPMVELEGSLAAPVNDHSPFFDVAASDESARAQAVAALLASEHRSIVFDALPEQSPTVRLVLGGCEARRPVRRTRHVSPIVDTSVPWDEFRERTRHGWGAPLERFRRKMIRENDATFHLIERPHDLDSILDRGFAVEASGWKGRTGTAILSRPDTRRFYHAVAHASAARGELAVSWLSFGEEVVAFDLDLLSGNRLYLLKTGFDESHRRLAPGLVLRLALIERCIELGLEAHELLGDEDDWKRKFAGDERRQIELRLYRRQLRGTLAWGYRRYARPPLRRVHARLAEHRG